jgi:hypothetical protein
MISERQWHVKIKMHFVFTQTAITGNTSSLNTNANI